jgi:hypothetical protein
MFNENDQGRTRLQSVFKMKSPGLSQEREAFSFGEKD